MSKQTSTTTVTTVRDRDALHRPLPPDEVTNRDDGFAFHCTCGATTVGYRSRSSACRASVTHRSECAGGDVPSMVAAMPNDVEVATRYATTVTDLAAAWAFVMSRLDGVGPDPDITIRPIHQISFGIRDYGDGWTRVFEVVVKGTVTETEGQP